MTSKRRASLAQGDFIHLIFGCERLTFSLCVPVYNQIERNPDHVSRIITDEGLMLKLLSDFDLYASRVAQFFNLLNTNSVSRSVGGGRRKSCVSPGLADELIENVLFRLLGEDFQEFRLRPTFLDISASIINFCLPIRPRSLEVLAKRLRETESLLEALVCGETSSRVMKEWINIFSNTIFDFKIIGAWTRRLITQCRSCHNNHNIPEQVAIWEKLDDLIGRLTNILVTYPKVSQALPSLENLRKLTGEDKKSGATTRAQEPGLKLPPGVNDMLQYFRIQPPKSERTLKNTLEKLEKDEILKVLLAIVDSFPCRTCYDVLTRSSAGTGSWGTAAEMIEGPFLFTELLGRGIGTWRVFVSSQALKDLQQAYVDGHLEQVETKLVQLASGYWLHNSLCDQVGEEGQDMLYQALYEMGGILWQKDVEFDEESDTATQLVKVWRIGNIKEISTAIPHIFRIYKTYPQSRLEACKHVSIEGAVGRNIPSAFGGSFAVEVTHPTLKLEEIVDQNLLETHFQFNKFHMVTQTTIDNLLSGNTRAEYPLVLSEEELEIIKNSRTSTLILGRSGTGKTTCLVYKLFGRFLVANRWLERPRRQLLLTRSSILSDKLKHYTKRLIATHLNDANPTMGDGEDPDPMTEDDREVNGTVFSIEDKDFPLVCTFDHFIQLLENTARSTDRKDFSAAKKPDPGQVNKWDPSMGPKRTWLRLYRRAKVVDFEVFSEEYWPSFPNNLIKHVSVTLAFMEIIGVIKGSACRSTKFRPLTRDEYRAGSHKIPVFVDRDLVYDIYERYENMKRQFGDIDDVDRARSVLEAISNNSDLRDRIERAFDEVYVDEIQDQRLLEIKLLLHLIKRPNAIHFAGDTAQSISKDSVFRFQNVKHLLYEQFSGISILKKSPELAKPKLYKLYKNYRTHQGILSVATSVMRLLYKCFPDMVDHLPDEEGQFWGPKPTVFVGFDATVFSSRMFGAVDLHADTAKFGAEQVIIVRDFPQKAKLKKAVGDFALILTVMESKGMEFEDVLLYDFFATSECISAFRALAHPTGSYGEMDIALCSELKQLYVAITRAQNRLWFFESSEANLKPIMGIWEPIVEVAHTNDRDIREKLTQLRPGTQANPGVWSTKGNEFIHKKDYENALFCFGRAQDPKGKLLASAFIAEKKGNALLAKGDEDRSEKYFREATVLFHECKRPLREASCYETLGMFKEAAGIFSENGEFGRAADLYNKIDYFEMAAMNYSRAKRYNEGAYTLARGNLFDNLVYYLTDYGSNMNSSCRLHYARLCNLLLYRGKISPELKELTIATFQTDSEKEGFFLEYEITSHLSEFYIDRGRYSDACKLAIESGDLNRAWELNEKYGSIHKLQQQQRIEVFNYAQAKHLLANLTTGPGQIFLPDANWITECPWLSDNLPIQDFWGNLEKTINGLWRHEISYESISFADTWMKQLFDIIVTYKAHAFINPARAVMQLPIESINEVLRMAKEILTSGTIPTPVLIFLRVFPVEHRKKTKSYTILDSSPLVTELGSPLPSDTASIVPIITRWTLDQVCKAVDKLHAKALELCNGADPCVSVLSQGICRKPPGRCKYYHSQITPAEYSVHINDFLRINSIFCNLSPLYYTRFGGLGLDGFSENFRPRQRKWLEGLLAKITYVSSLENAPGILANTRRDISREGSPHSVISGELETLLFHRLKAVKDWERTCDFSSMLEQIQIAEVLGVQRSFRRLLRLKINWSSEQSRKSWEALQSIESSLLRGIDQSSVGALDEVIQTIECKELCSYHAVASLYEKMAAFLIYASHPTDFLLPNGWVEMYIRQMPHHFSLKEHGIPKLEYREALLSLIRSFCNLVQKINSDTQFQHKISGRTRAWELGLTAFIRRNADFLVTCILNAFSWQTSPIAQGPVNLGLKYVQTRTLVQKTLGLAFANSPELQDFSTDYSLARKFIRSFDRYAGKDNVCLIQATSNTASFFSFLGSSVPTILLESLLSPVASETKTASSETTPYVFDGEPGNYTQGAVSAAETIQRMWRMRRTRYQKAQKRQEFFKSPSGQAIIYIQRVCKTVLEGAPLDRRERMLRTGVLFSDGLDTYLYAKKIEKLYLGGRECIKTRIDNADTSQMESFQFQWEEISEIRDRASESVDFLSEKNWKKLDIPGQQLSQKFREVLRALKDIEVDLHMIGCTERGVAATKAIQQVWRAYFRVVKQRREFLKTPHGQAVSYIHRIYKEVLQKAPLDRNERIRRAAVLFSNGPDIYMCVKTVEGFYLKIKHAIKLRIGGVHSIEIERARNQWKKMSEIRHDVRRNAGFLSEKNWKELDIPSQELRTKLRETMAFLGGVEAALCDIKSDGFF